MIRFDFWCTKEWVEAHGKTVIVKENGYNDASSNPGRGCLYFTFAFGKGMNPATGK